MYDPSILAIAAALAPTHPCRNDGQGSRAPLYVPRTDDRPAREAPRRSPPTYELPRESYHDDSRRALRGVARQVPGDSPSYQNGVDTVSQQFKIGLTILAAMAAGSILFHLVWPV